MAFLAGFLLLLSCTPLHLLRSSEATSITTTTAVHNRRTLLHQPFFPLASSSLPPTQPPSSSFPKSPSVSRFRPFFPLYPSPPLHPAVTLPTLPVSISPLESSSSRRPSRHLLRAVAAPLLAVALLGLAFALFLHLRHRGRRGGTDKDARSDSLRFFPPDTTASDGRKLSATSSAAAAPAGSEFLYLGTLISSRGRPSEGSASQSAAGAGGGSPYRKLGSPELRPLPPLPRQVRSGEAVHSPKNSPRAEESVIVMGSSSKKPDLAAETQRCCSWSATLSTPSYISSNVASSPSRSSPINSSPPPQKPPQLLQPPPPSPPKRRPRSHSPPSSLLAADCESGGSFVFIPTKHAVTNKNRGLR